MKTIYRAVLALATSALLLPAALAAGGSSTPLTPAQINLNDQPSLQRGAKSFVNYCLNCHSAQFMRYSHLTQIGLTEAEIKANFMFNPAAKIGDPMVSGLDAKDAKDWLVASPPDLTLIARSRGSDWLYTFMRSFYRDDSAPSGWNNLVSPNVAMPHVLHDLQGTLSYQKIGEKMNQGKMEPVMKLTPDRGGSLSALEYDLVVRDLVNFMTYMAEPVREQRIRIGVMVLLFLTLAFFVVLFLKNDYWKDVK